MEYFTSDEIKAQKQSEISKRYEGYAGRNINDFFAANLVEKYHNRVFGNRKEQTKILDYGTASGVFATQVAQKGFRNIYGLDRADYVDQDKKSAFAEFKLADLNTDTLPWSDNFFDIITAWCVFPHLENPHHGIRETFRILKPGGLLILSIPHLLSRASVQYFLKHKDFARYHPEKDHITVFTPGVFQIAFLRYFDVVNMEYFIDPRSLQGLKGKIRKFILSAATINKRLKNYFENRWGYNQIWILKKK